MKAAIRSLTPHDTIRPTAQVGVTFVRMIRCRAADISKSIRKKDPGHFRNFTGPLAMDTHADVAASAVTERANGNDIDRAPEAKSSIGVLSPRLDFRTARRGDSRRAVFLSTATVYAVFLTFAASSNRHPTPTVFEPHLP